MNATLLSLTLIALVLIAFVREVGREKARLAVVAAEVYARGEYR